MNSSFFETCLKETRVIVLKHTPPDVKVFLFGSSAKKLRTKSSDIDVGFLGSRPVPKENFLKLREEIENSNIPFHVDLVDFSNVSEEFKQTALKEIVPWKF